MYNINDLETIISYKKINMILITTSEISSELNKALLIVLQNIKLKLKKHPY